ncbi:hypothetical protein BN1723_018724, partial [Verticillium longisporum]
MSYPAITPARPVPGAFLNTPAASRFQSNDDPVRRRLFDGNANPAPSSSLVPRPNQSSATTSSTSGMSGGLVAASHIQQQAPDVPPVTKAAQAVNEFLQRDQNYPDLESYAKSGSSSEYDLVSIDSAWAPFHKTQMYPIPNEIFNHYNASQLQTLMGLFAEINH